MAISKESSAKQTTFEALCLILEARKQAREEIRSKDPQTQAFGYLALADTYHSIEEEAILRLEKIPHFDKRFGSTAWRTLGWSLIWLPLLVWCHYRMLPLSNRAVKLVGGDDNLTLGQKIFLQRILRERGRWERARDCILLARRETRSFTLTRALLSIGLAEVHFRRGKTGLAMRSLRSALRIAEVLGKSNPEQEEEIFREYARAIRRSPELISIVELN